MRFNIHFEIIFSQDMDEEDFLEGFDAEAAAKVVRDVFNQAEPHSLADLSSVECLKITKGEL